MAYSTFSSRDFVLFHLCGQLIFYSTALVPLFAHLSDFLIFCICLNLDVFILPIRSSLCIDLSTWPIYNPPITTVDNIFVNRLESPPSKSFLKNLFTCSIKTRFFHYFISADSNWDIVKYLRNWNRRNFHAREEETERNRKKRKRKKTDIINNRGRKLRVRVHSRGFEGQSDWSHFIQLSNVVKIQRSRHCTRGPPLGRELIG